MRTLVECVPNFSEGRDLAVIDAIADAIRATAGCTLLDVDPGASTNRTVYTFVGAPDAEGNYAVDHSAAIFLVDPQARVSALFGGPHDSAVIARDYRRIVAAEG